MHALSWKFHRNILNNYGRGKKLMLKEGHGQKIMTQLNCLYSFLFLF